MNRVCHVVMRLAQQEQISVGFISVLKCDADAEYPQELKSEVRKLLVIVNVFALEKFERCAHTELLEDVLFCLSQTLRVPSMNLLVGVIYKCICC